MSRHIQENAESLTTTTLEQSMLQVNGLLEARLKEISRMRAQGCSALILRQALNETLRCELRDRSVRLELLMDTVHLAESVVHADGPVARSA